MSTVKSCRQPWLSLCLLVLGIIIIGPLSPQPAAAYRGFRPMRQWVSRVQLPTGELCPRITPEAVCRSPRTLEFTFSDGCRLCRCSLPGKAFCWGGKGSVVCPRGDAIECAGREKGLLDNLKRYLASLGQ